MNHLPIIPDTVEASYLGPTKEQRRNQAHCVEVEQRLLGTLLWHNECFADAALILRPEHFIEDLHGRLFEAIGSNIESRGVCDVISLIAEFRDDPVLQQIGGARECLPGLMRIAGIPIQVKQDAAMIHEYAQRRRVAWLAGELIEQARNAPMTERSDMVAEAVQAFQGDEMVSERVRRTRYEGGELATSVVERLNAAFRDGKPTETHPFCGSHDLMRALGGWKRKRLYVIGGRPGMGKSSVASSWLLRTVRKGHGTLILTLEMEAKEMMERCLADIAWSRDLPIPYQDISNDNLTEAWQIERMTRAEAEFQGLPVVIDEATKPSLARVRQMVTQVAQRMAAKGQKLEVVCIDHLTLMDLGDDQNMAASIEAVTGGLKAMAKDMDIAVVLLCQLNRGVEGREEKRPTLADLRWSGGIEQDADVVLLLYREAYYLQHKKETDPTKEIERETRLQRCLNDLEVIVAKNRGGATKTITFFADMACCAIRDRLN